MQLAMIAPPRIVDISPGITILLENKQLKVAVLLSTAAFQPLNHEVVVTAGGGRQVCTNRLDMSIQAL
jgi:hypothetical protein